ncbi:MAG: 23S rRNA (pseudouridine(1915)-N(3))-methyltransferase RlmH [Pseudomonadota bacterium]|nr:MAG: 23S rRNA (pseudouridine(1915)-N(3))-methyltransferase RlmH [Pseudomonadota bacterium]
MRIQLIAVGTRMPKWVDAGFEEYARRMPRECGINLVEIPLAKRNKGASTPRLIASEGEKILAAIAAGNRVLALDVAGQQWSTEQLAVRLGEWLESGRNLSLLVGGPDGLATQCRSRADGLWSLSRLTLPHPLVRVLVAEQLYRAFSIIKGHPYHK